MLPPQHLSLMLTYLLNYQRESRNQGVTFKGIS
jgi:hypothetical protein